MSAPLVRKLNSGLDDRLGSQSFLSEAMDHIFPDNWSFMIGETAFYCFVILIITGIYLSLFFDPSDSIVIYHGSYVPLHGVQMSEAYRSTVDLSLDVRAGLLFRQIHHWAADLFLAAILAHLIRLFFTGAFRKPRDINWAIGVTMLIVSMFNGFTGYSLPDDLLSGSGLRIAYSITESVPVIGNWLAYLFFGGQFPSDQVSHRFFIAHVLIAPAIIAALLAVHLALIWRQKHTQFPGKGRSRSTVVGSQLWPTYAARSLALFCAVGGLMAMLAGLAQINPIWLYGPYTPDSASAAAQPDWYVGWLEGALRLFPAWRPHVFGYAISEVFWPAVAFPVASFAALYAWPWLERWWTGDLMSHNLLDRPRDRPGRTAIGAAVMTLYLVLFVAGAQDVLAHYLKVTQPPVTLTLRGMAIGLPLVVAAVTWRVCRDLRPGRAPEVQEPQGPAGSATPPLSEYLERQPSSRRGAYAGGETSRAARSAGTVGAVAGGAAIVGLALRRRARRQGKSRVPRG